MLSETEIYNIAESQLAWQLHASIQAAVTTVVAPVPVRAAEPAHWIESTIDEFKRQAPGTLILMTDGSYRYVPTGKTSTRGPTDSIELEVRLSFRRRPGHWSGLGQRC